MNSKACTSAVKENYAELARLLEEKLLEVCAKVIKTSVDEIKYMESDVRMILQIVIALYFKRMPGKSLSREVLEVYIEELSFMKNAIPVATQEHFQENIQSLLEKNPSADEGDSTVATPSAPEAVKMPTIELHGALVPAAIRNYRENTKSQRTYRTVDEIEEIYHLAHGHGYSDEQIAFALQLPIIGIKKLRAILISYPIDDELWERFQSALYE